jgi:hypothetical protein
MRRLLLFAFLFSGFAANACGGDKVQTPTSDSNFDDDGDPGHMNDPGTPVKDAGHEAAPPHDAGAEASDDANNDANPEASTDAADDGATTD